MAVEEESSGKQRMAIAEARCRQHISGPRILLELNTSYGVPSSVGGHAPRRSDEAGVWSCGLGYMGIRIASRLIDAGYPVGVYNRTRDKMRALAERGARVYGSPRELAADADAILSMLANDAAIGQTAVVTPGQKHKLENVRSGEYPVEFPLRLMDKDLLNVEQLAGQLAVPTPAIAAARQMFAVEQAKGREEDFSAVHSHRGGACRSALVGTASISGKPLTVGSPFHRCAVCGAVRRWRWATRVGEPDWKHRHQLRTVVCGTTRCSATARGPMPAITFNTSPRPMTATSSSRRARTRSGSNA